MIFKEKFIVFDKFAKNENTQQTSVRDSEVQLQSFSGLTPQSVVLKTVVLG